MIFLDICRNFIHGTVLSIFNHINVAGISADWAVSVSRDGGRHWEVLEGSERVPSGCSSKVLVDRGRLFYLSTGSGVFTRTLFD